MAAAHVADRGSSFSDSNLSAYTVTLTNPTSITVGNHLILCFCNTFGSSTESISSITDPRSNTWQVDKFQARATSFIVSIASARVATGYQAADTLTVNLGAAATCGIWELNEFSGLASSSWLDQTASNDGGASNTTTLDSGTTATLSQSAELAIGAFGEGALADGTWTPDGDWTALGGQASTNPIRGLLAAYKVLSATTGEQLGGTQPSTTYAGAIVTYKAAVAATGRPDRMMLMGVS